MKPGPDRLVRDILRAGIAMLKDPASDDLWTLLLDGWEASEVARLRDGFRAVPPTAKLSWARSEDPWPLWSVALASESPNTKFLGNSGGKIVRVRPHEDPKSYRRIAIIMDATVSVWIVSPNADVVREHSDIAKALIFGAALDIYGGGYESFGLQVNHELNPLAAYLPEKLMLREQVWSFLGYEASVQVFPAGYLHPPGYVGLEGYDLGDGHVGKVEVEH